VLGHRRDPPSPGHQADPPGRRHRRPGALQGELLDALWKTLEVGGILLYATCSTLPTENTEVIEAFLARTRAPASWTSPRPPASSSPTVANCWPKKAATTASTTPS
jgi:16S rRNA C967 or C1407 C5-methylase (RsmB/RsmF family)